MNASPYTPSPGLVQRFTEIKDYLPRGRFSRWEQFRLLFGTYAITKNWAAQHAIWQLNDYGERTRIRWIEEYRHQRTLRAIDRQPIEE